MLTVVGNDSCPYCVKAKSLLTELQIPFEDINSNNCSPETRKAIENVKMDTIPQIYFGEIKKENLIGGYDELKNLLDNFNLLILQIIDNPEGKNFLENNKSNMNNTITNYDLYNGENPKSAALFNYSSTKAENLGVSGVVGAGLGGLAVVGGMHIASGGATAFGALAGGIASTIAGIVTQRNAKSDEMKAMAPGFEFAGAIGTVSGIISLAGFTSIFGIIASILGGLFAYNILYYYLTGKREKAIEAINSKLAPEKAKEVIAKVDQAMEKTEKPKKDDKAKDEPKKDDKTKDEPKKDDKTVIRV